MATRKIFVNLAVKDLERSKDFFTRLGFEIDPRFTDEKAACVVLSADGYVMLLAEPFFRTFTRRQPCDTRTHTEGLFALSCERRAEVDDLVERAIALGGSRAVEPQDLGFMYSASFYDPDGHHWEAFWMDPAAAA